MYKYLILLFIAIFLSSCSRYNQQDVKYDLKIDQKNKSIIKGKIKKNKKSSKDIYIILYKHMKGDIDNFDNYKLVDFSMNSISTKEYKFTITKGNYIIYACQNLETLRDEKYAYSYESDIINIDKNSIVNIDIKLDPTPSLATDDNILIGSTKQNSIFKRLQEIRQISLNDEKFSRKNANIGLWDPFDFFENIGGGLFLLGEYNKNKQAVLFIHGIKGTPRDFTHIINSLDKEKYLPIIYYYPSGINLNYSVNTLEYYIKKLKKSYNIKELVILSHSMGGLVSRGFINNNKDIKIDKFISIATPWNGQKYANLGGEFAKKIAPSFGNLIPKSSFLQNIQNIKFPKHLKHYLIFAYKGKRSLILDNSNDGLISLSSQLYPKAQEQAHKIYGFNESHVSVLKSQKTIQYINNILNEK